MPQHLSKTDEADEAELDHVFGKEGYTYPFLHKDGTVLQASNKSSRQTAEGYLYRLRELENLLQGVEQRLKLASHAVQSNDLEGGGRHIFHARTWLRLSGVIEGSP
jgi:hypothetical protein